MSGSTGQGADRRPSIKDVAGRAGVSFQTASKVLRGGGSVAPATRSRIVAAAHEIGYVANEVARSLVTRSTRTIAIVVGDLGDHIITRFVQGAEAEARRRHHAVLIVSLRDGGDEGERSLRTLLERRVDGVVVAAPQLELDERLSALLRGHVPVVGIHSVAGGGIGLVGSDQRTTARLAVDHLLGLGHSRVGMVTGTGSRRVARSRSQGYAAALDAAGVGFDDAIVAEGNWQPAGGYSAARDILDRRGDVTALYVQNDLMAVGVLHAAHERRRAVPADLAVVGCDDIPIAAHTFPTLTTVRLPFAESGAEAVRMLLDAPGGRLDPEAAPVLLPVSLVCRESCGCAAGRPAAAETAVATQPDPPPPEAVSP